jgi:hypothetical protein
MKDESFPPFVVVLAGALFVLPLQLATGNRQFELSQSMILPSLPIASEN